MAMDQVPGRSVVHSLVPGYSDSERHENESICAFRIPRIYRLFSNRAHSQIFYSQPYTFVASSLSLAYLTTTLTVRFPFSSERLRHPQKERQTMLIQTYYFTWILLLVSTFVLSKWQIGVVYIVSGWNACVLLGTVFGLSGYAIKGEQRRVKTSPTPGGTPSEHTPPITPPQTPEQSRGVEPAKAEKSDWWIVQLLLVVPLPITLFLHLLVLLVASLSQTLSDGNNPVMGEHFHRL